MTEGCDARLELTVAEYERIRTRPTWFYVVQGHTVPGVEDVVDMTDGYIVVEKIGAAATVAARLHAELSLPSARSLLVTADT